MKALTQADLRRFIEAARKTGMKIVRIEIGTNPRITVEYAIEDRPEGGSREKNPWD